MSYLIGTDEAGYGPNLGPLVVSASVWRVPEGVGSDDLYERLAPAVVPTLREVVGNGHARVAMADSKALYQPGKGLRHLERGLWTAFALMGWPAPRTWSEVCRALAPDSFEPLRSLPWYAGYEPEVPLDVNPDELRSPAAALREEFSETDVRLLKLRSRAVSAERFNRLLEQHGSKGLALSHLTLDLIAQVTDDLAEGPISIVCDKHGGRNRYADLLSEHFPDALVEIYDEGRQRSLYRFGPAERRVDVRFQVKAESHLPVALASMASKYLRELAMAALNRFWAQQVPGLPPTAGYPQDARRFHKAIAAAQQSLGIGDAMLWRTK